MEAPTATSPTSHERYYKGNMGVDNENVPLVDLRIRSIVACNMKCVACNNDIDACCVETNLMKNCSFPVFVHTYDNPLGMLCPKCYIKDTIASNMMKNCSFKCIACNDDINACCIETNFVNNCSFPLSVHANDIPLDMLCFDCYIKSPIACNKLDNCSFQCFACNDSCYMHDNEITPIAFSIVGDFDKYHDKHVHMNNLHICHAFHSNLIDANRDVPMKRCIMMDDVFIYHAHTFFVWSFVCVGTALQGQPRVSTS